MRWWDNWRIASLMGEISDVTVGRMPQIALGVSGYSQRIVLVNNEQHVWVCEEGVRLPCCLGRPGHACSQGVCCSSGEAGPWCGPFIVTEIHISLGLRGCFFGIFLLSAWFKAESLRVKRPSP